MKKILNGISYLVILLAMAATADSVELKTTPLETQMASMVRFASDEPLQGFGHAKKESKDVKDMNGQEKSVLKAVLYSALLPGMGEYYVGNRKKARFFFAVEAMAWIGFVSQRTYGNWKQNDMRKYAADYAGASMDDKDRWFEDMVGFYSDLDTYNDRGRVDDPERPYLVDNPDNHWSWENTQSKNVYRGLKNSYRDAYRRAQFMVGLAIVNRIVSVIDAARDAKRVSSRVDEAFGSNKEKGLKLRVDLDPMNVHRPVGLTLYKEF